MVWLNRERASKVLQRLVAPASLRKRAAEVAVRRCRFGRKIDCFAQVRDRVFEATCGEQEDAEFIVSLGKARIERESPLECPDRIRPGARRRERSAEIELQVGIVGREHRGLAEVRHGVSGSSRLQQSSTQLVVRTRRTWIDLHGML
jgi:hypothetical protein